MFLPQALRCGALWSGIRFWTCRWFGEKLGEVHYEQKRQARGGPAGHLPGWAGHSQVLLRDEVVGAVLPAVLLDGDPGDCRLYRRYYLSVPVGREIQPEIQSWSDLMLFLAALPVKGSAVFHSVTVSSSSSCRAFLCSSFYSSWKSRSYIACLG